MSRRADWTQVVSGRLRALAIMEAAERAALTPIPLPRLHALAYLADVLSPVWGLSAFDPVALKTGGEPFFGRFQDELDDLVVLGLAEVASFKYEAAQPGARAEVVLNAEYQLRYASSELRSLIAFIQLDRELGVRLDFFISLALAMARLSDRAIADAVTKDAAWEDGDVPEDYAVQFKTASGARKLTRTDGTVALLQTLPLGGIHIEKSATLRMYAAFLAERLKVA